MKRNGRMRPLRWREQVQHMAMRRRGDGQQIAFIVSQDAEGLWFAGAVESAGETVDEMLASHGHKLLGESFKTRRAAQAACAKFAREWFRKSAAVAPCACDEIALEPLREKVVFEAL